MSDFIKNWNKPSDNKASPIQLVGFEDANSFSIADDVSVNIRKLINSRSKLLSKMRKIRKRLMKKGYSKDELLKSSYGRNVYVMRNLTSILKKLGIIDPKKIRIGMRDAFNETPPKVLIHDASEKFSKIVFSIVDSKKAHSYMGDSFMNSPPELIVYKASPQILKKEIDESFLESLKILAEVISDIKELYGVGLEAMEAEVQEAIGTSLE